MGRFGSCSFLVLLLPTMALTQTITFTKTLGGAQGDEGSFILRTSDGVLFSSKRVILMGVVLE